MAKTGFVGSGQGQMTRYCESTNDAKLKPFEFSERILTWVYSDVWRNVTKFTLEYC